MAEQGLKAVVYPELDENGMAEFVKSFQEQLGSGFVNVGMNIPDTVTQNNAQSKSETKTEDTSPKTPVQEDKNDNLTKPEVTEAVTDGIDKSNTLNKTDAEKSEENEKKQTLKDSLGAIVGKITSLESIRKITESETGQKLGNVLGKAGEIGSAIGVGAVSVAQYAQKILAFLTDASPALREVFNIFGQLVQLIWMPIGTILAVELMPMITEMAQDIGKWMAEAWEIYDKEGWTGLIKGAVITTFDVLAEILGFILPPIFTALGEMIWDGLGDAWRGFASWIKDGWADFVGWIWDGLVNSAMGQGIAEFISYLPVVLGYIVEVVTSIFNAYGVMVSTIIDWFGDFFSDPVEAIKNLPTTIWNGMKDGLEALLQPINNIVPGFTDGLKSALSIFDGPIQWIQDIWGALVKPITGVVDTVNNFVNDPVGTMTNGFNNMVSNTVNTIKSVLPFFAEGGIVNEPTLGVIGESGPEMVIPLDRFNEMNNQYNTVMSGDNKMDSLSNTYKIDNQNINGGNVMNFYISGDNPREIGGEVQRILEKTVGKASSKMMWW